MNNATIHPGAQAIIDRLAAHSCSRSRIDRTKVETAITAHLRELGLPPQPFKWFSTARDGHEAAPPAAQDPLDEPQMLAEALKEKHGATRVLIRLEYEGGSTFNYEAK